MAEDTIEPDTDTDDTTTATPPVTGPTPDADATDTATVTAPASTEASKPGAPVRTDMVPRTEVDRLAKELRIAVKEAKDRKEKLAEIEAANATEAEKALIAARAEAAAEREAALRPAIVSARAEAALASAGCTDPDKQERMLRLIDPATVELNDAGKVIGGLVEQVEAIKADFPEAFTVPKQRVPSAREVDGGNKTAPVRELSVGEMLARKATGTS